MKNLLILVFLLLAMGTNAQNLPQNPNKIDKNNLKQGLWTTFHDEKYLLVSDKDAATYYAVGEMIDNKQNGIWTYFDIKTNTKKAVTTLKDNIANGLGATYHPNGQISSQGMVINGAYQGLWYIYHSNGKTQWEMRYKDSKRVGVAKEYDSTGKLIREVEYEDGKLKQTPIKEGQTWGELYEEGKAYLKTGESGKAIIIFEKVRTQTEKEVSKKHQYYVKVLDDLALAYLMNKQFDKAKELSIEALATQESLSGTDNALYADLLNTLFNAEFDLKDFASAQQSGTKLLAIYKKILGEKSNNYIVLEKNLAYIHEKINKK
jgi:hypothetical protein